MLRTTDEPSTQLAEWNGCSLLCSVCSWLDRFVSAGRPSLSFAVQILSSNFDMVA